MKKRHYLSIALMALLTVFSSDKSVAQTLTKKVTAGMAPNGIVYMLPSTAVAITASVEKTIYTPGRFAKYAERYMNKRGVAFSPFVSWRLIDVKARPIGLPDTSRCYAVRYNAKTSAANITLSDDGLLLAINAEPIEKNEEECFAPYPKPEPVDTEKYMNSEILQAGSTAKMAELTAQEIFAIRDSKNELNRGEADYMPKDGQQLRIMLANLQEQDDVLTSLFEGTLVKDTTEQTITYTPKEETDGEIIFRFSKKLGLLDSDDLAGSPYFIKVEDEHTAPRFDAVDERTFNSGKGVYVCTPSKVRLTIFNAERNLLVREIPMAQFGRVSLLSAELFNRRTTTHVTIDGTTGGIVTFMAEEPE